MVDATTFWAVIGAAASLLVAIVGYLVARIDAMVRQHDYDRDVERIDEEIALLRRRSHDLAGRLGRLTLDQD